MFFVEFFILVFGYILNMTRKIVVNAHIKAISTLTGEVRRPVESNLNTWVSIKGVSL